MTPTPAPSLRQPSWRLAASSTLLLGLAALAPEGRAATLYKCQTPAGAVAIQSEPCPKGSTQVWARDATPEAPASSEQAAQAELRRAQESEDAKALAKLAGNLGAESASVPPPVTPPPAPPPPAPAAAPAASDAPKGPCRQAHEFADGVRAKPWLELSDLQMRRLDDWVAGQCRDPGAPG